MRVGLYNAIFAAKNEARFFGPFGLKDLFDVSCREKRTYYRLGNEEFI